MAESTITHLRQGFATHGLPKIIVSDNGPAFISSQHSSLSTASVTLNLLLIMLRQMGSLKGQSKL